MGDHRSFHQVRPVELEEIGLDAGTVLTGGEPPELEAPGDGIGLAPDAGDRLLVFHRIVRCPHGVDESPQRVHGSLLADSMNEKHCLFLRHLPLPPGSIGEVFGLAGSAIYMKTGCQPIFG